MTAGRPLISVVMPCYRESLEVLGRTVDSILGQTYEELELVVVVDDPSQTETIKMLRSRAGQDSRVSVFVNPQNLGVWPSYNRGVREARGDLVAIQDADDTSLPNRLERLQGFLAANPEVDVVGSGLEYVSSDSGETLLVRHYPPVVGGEMRRYSPLAHATTLRRAGLYERYGFYDESERYRHAADYELWCRWFSAGVRMANVQEVLYRYFQSESNFKTQNVKAILRDTLRIKRAYARRLRFGARDYGRMGLELAATALPPATILAIFYALNRHLMRSMVAPPRAAATDTASKTYTQLLERGESASWKRLLDVQRPYRWNLRRLQPGFVLDVGCGLGRNLLHLGGRGVGIDHNAHSVAVARQRGLLAFSPSEFSESVWDRPGRFDSLLLSHVVEHLGASEAQNLIGRYLSNVKLGGKVIIIVPQRAGFGSDESHVEFYGRPELTKLAKHLGLTLAGIHSFPFPELIGRHFVHNETVMVCRR